MAGKDDGSGCGCIFLIFLIIGGTISAINGCREEKKSRNLRPDYSSKPSEEGNFERGIGTLNAQGFRVADGIGYLTLSNGHVLKMWRNKYGEYEGRFEGQTYTAKKTGYGYEVRQSK